MELSGLGNCKDLGTVKVKKYSGFVTFDYKYRYNAISIKQIYN